MAHDRATYGATSNNRNHANHGGDEETAPLLNGSSKVTRSWSGRLMKHLKSDITNAWADVPLLICYIITGILDSSSILIWGSFVSMQTGNTIYIGLGLAQPATGTRWIKASVSVVCFCLGSYLFARWHRHLGPRRRWVLTSSFIVQTLLIVAAAVILLIDTDDDGDTRWEVLVGIGLVAFQAGGQAVTSRALEFNALNSVVLTSIYCDLFSDARLFAPPTQNVARNQRLAAPICLLIGAIIGGVLGRSGDGILAALWCAAGIKLLLTITWLVWRTAEDDE